MRYWLMKSEPDEISVDDVLTMPGSKVAWFGVRNYQARNFMRDDMRAGDGVLFYHSTCAVPGVAGIAQVACAAYPDATQFDAASKYFDAKSTRENPRWMNVDVKVLRKTRLLTLADIRAHDSLASMVLLRKGNRLSITPVTDAEWAAVMELLA